MNWKRLTALLCAVVIAGTVCVVPASAASVSTLQTVIDLVTGTAAGTEDNTESETASASAAAAAETAQTADSGTETAQTDDSGLRTFSSNFGQITVEQLQTQTQRGILSSRIYTMEQDTTCAMLRLVPLSEYSGEAASLVIPGTLQMVRWLDADTDTWMATAVLENVPDAAVLFVQTDQASAILYAPAVYEARENEMIEELPDCGTSLTLTVTDSGLQVSWQVQNVPDSAQIEIFYTVSGMNLVDWSSADEMEAWKDLILTGDNRWTYDGYYYRTPSTYYPTGDNYFHRIPDPYITLKMLDQSDSSGAVVQSVCMLDVMLELLNADGYYPTYAQSSWLSEDYGIGAGYFDTRWNADLTLGLLKAWELYGIEEFLTYAEANGEFWLSYIPAHSRTVSSGSITGILVEDYWQASGNTAVHTSLNHQLAEILMLYRLGDITGSAAYTELADQMLDGIRAVGLSWVTEDSDLWYRIDPDGTLTGTDYETLTYDDMYKLQAYLTESGRGSDTVLTALMLYKKTWMDANGITDYLQ